ncbi:MAG: hypothetical protein E7G96_02530 [Serratia liquefaciens]|nr:hypothetical protein [Serratia liquefaciens]
MFLGLNVSDWISSAALIVSVSSILFTYKLGYKSAVKNEQRKEWNIFAEKILKSLEEQKELLSGEILPHMHPPYFPYDEIASLKRRVTKREMAKMEVLLSEHKNILEEIGRCPNPAFAYHYNQEDESEWVNRYPEAVKCVDNLMDFFKLR